MSRPRASQDVNGDEGRSKAASRADAERPARAEMIGHPADDRRADRRAAQRDRRARIAITRPRMAGSVESCIRLLVDVGEGLRGHADDDQRDGRRASSSASMAASVQPSPKTAAPTSSKPIRGLLAAGGQQRAGDRADRHDRRQQAVSGWRPA